MAPHTGIFSEYNSLIINLGYVVLFAPAFPVAAAICYLTFLIELRTDAYKLLYNVRRTRCLAAEDIGSWMRVLHLLSTLATLTNVALLGFTSGQFQEWLRSAGVVGEDAGGEHSGGKAIVLFLIEHAILLFQYLVSNVMSDLPVDTSVQRALKTWRKEAAKEALNGVYVATREEWDDKRIPRKFFATLNGKPVPATPSAQTERARPRGAAVAPAAADPVTDRPADALIAPSWSRELKHAEQEAQAEAQRFESATSRHSNGDYAA
jgi:hypothetical protein